MKSSCSTSIQRAAVVCTLPDGRRVLVEGPTVFHGNDTKTSLPETKAPIVSLRFCFEVSKPTLFIAAVSITLSMVFASERDQDTGLS